MVWVKCKNVISKQNKTIGPVDVSSCAVNNVIFVPVCVPYKVLTDTTNNVKEISFLMLRRLISMHQDPSQDVHHREQ